MMEKLEKLEKLEKYVITPNVRFYGGFVFDGNDIDLCDDTNEEFAKIIGKNGEMTEKKVAEIKVKQKIVNSILITELESSHEMINGKNVREKSYLETELDKGQVLVYLENQGFVISEYNMCTIDEAIEKYNLLKSPINEE